MAYNPTSLNLLTTKKFKVVFSRFPYLSFYTNEVALPDMQGDTNSLKFPGNTSRNYASYSGEYGEFSINFSIDENFQGYIEMKNWWEMVFNNRKDLKGFLKDSNQRQDHMPSNALKSDASILVTDNEGKINIEFNLQGILPTFLSGLKFAVSDSNNSDQISATVSFKVEDYFIKMVNK